MAGNAYTGFATGLMGGYALGSRFMGDLENRKDRETRERIAMMEADFESWSPPEYQQPAGALPDPAAMSPEVNGGINPDQTVSSMDGRQSAAQGYTGNTLKQMMDSMRREAAALGDPEYSAALDWRLTRSLGQRAQSHLMSALNVIHTDPAAAQEEFAKASAYFTDGRAPTINIVTGRDGTPVVIHTASDPKTGQPVTTSLTPDMLRSMLMQTQGDVSSYLAGINGIEQTQLAQANLYRTRRFQAYNAARETLTELQAAAKAEVDAYAKKGVRKVKREIIDPETGNTTTIEQDEPVYVDNPVIGRMMTDVIYGIVADNALPPDTALAGEGAKPIFTVDPSQAHSLAYTLLDSFVKGVPVPSYVKMEQRSNGYATFQFNGQRVRMGESMLDALYDEADKERAKMNLPPLPRPGQETPQDAGGVPGTPQPTGAIPVNGAPQG